MTAKALLAAVLTAAALAPAPAAVASCHLCFAPVPCDAACEVVYDVLATVESRSGSSASHDLGHAVCVLLRDNTGINMACEH